MDLSNFLWWSTLNFISIVILAFYSMAEMACVSLNKIRLHYYVSKGMKRAIWLNYILKDPARLFGTTLLCVNAAMMAGSEFARESYLALGLDPDLAPLTQVLLVLIVGELAPMFAARRYAEHVAMLGAPILYVTAKLMTPLLWVLGWISKLTNILFGGKEVQSEKILNREDLQKILESQEEDHSGETEGPDFNTVTWNIFSLRNKDARHIMQPINIVPLVASTTTVGHLRQIISKFEEEYIPIYHKDIHHIVGIAIARNLIRIPDSKKARDYSLPPWFITQNTKVPQVLKEFRKTNNSIAIVLDDQGLAIGIITLKDLMEEIFGELREKPKSESPDTLIIDKSFPGDYKVSEFNKQFDVELDENGKLTLAELMTNVLGHVPEEGESVYLAPFGLTVKEASLMEIKRISITTHI